MHSLTQKNSLDESGPLTAVDLQTATTSTTDRKENRQHVHLGYVDDLGIANLARAIAAGAAQRLTNIQAVILLEGSVRPSSFSTAMGRAIVDLPIAQNKRIADLWLEQVNQLAKMLGAKDLPCRLMIGNAASTPAPRTHDGVRFTVENDPATLRGTGGVLHDLADQYPDEAYVVVANAAQLLIEDLAQVAIEAAESGGDMTIAANADGSPSNVMLISCKALRELPRIGFVDMKEQGLPLIAKKHRVTVMRRNRAFGMPIRNLREYMAALRAYDRLAAGEDPFERPFAERWASRFSIVEAGAAVDSGAHLHDSVVLAGGIVEAGASVVRSVVCDGGVVRRHEQRVDALVTGELK